MLIAGLPLLPVLIFAMLLGQSTPTPPTEPPIPPVVWELADVSSARNEIAEITDPEGYTVQFQPEGTLAVNANCIQSTGNYHAEEGTLNIDLSVSNPESCSTESKAQGEAFLAFLDHVARYEFTPDGFFVLGQESESLRLRARLTGVLWEWQSFRGGDDSRIEPDCPGEYTLTFLADGNVVIEVSCTHATSTYSVDGAALEIFDGGAIPNPCSRDSVTEQYLRDLEEVTSHIFRDGNLYLALWADAGIMEFTARYVEPPPATPGAGSFMIEPG